MSKVFSTPASRIASPRQCDLCKMPKTILALELWRASCLLLSFLWASVFGAAVTWLSPLCFSTIMCTHQHFNLKRVCVCVLQVVVNCYGESGNWVCGAARRKCMCVWLSLYAGMGACASISAAHLIFHALQTVNRRARQHHMWKSN